MNKICTSIEQSKKLIELRIDVNTADMVYLRSYFEETGEYNLLVGSYHESYAEKEDGTLIPVFDEHIPAWSLSALMNLLDDKAGLAKEYGLWFCYDNGKSHCTKHYQETIDAAFEMIIWLKENKKL
jgi:hypothetical protein